MDVLRKLDHPSACRQIRCLLRSPPVPSYGISRNKALEPSDQLKRSDEPRRRRALPENVSTGAETRSFSEMARSWLDLARQEYLPFLHA